MCDLRGWHTVLVPALLAALILLGTADPANATVFMRIGLEGGGDNVAVDAVDSDDSIVISSGTGSYFEFGKRIQTLTFSSVSVTTELAVGIKKRVSDSDSGSLKFNNFLFSASRFYTIGKVRMGAGLTLHNNNIMKVRGENFSDIERQPLWLVDDTVGITASIDYAFTKYIMFGWRALFIEYKLNDINNTRAVADGSSMGLYFAMLLE